MRTILFVLALVLAVTAQIELLVPQGRGYVVGDSQLGPCGNAGFLTFSPRVQWKVNEVETVEVYIHGSHGGGVLTDRYSCTLNGDLNNNPDTIYRLRGGVNVAVPDVSNRVVQLNVRAPPSRCASNATWQLIYKTREGPIFYQCLDLRVFNEGDLIYNAPTPYVYSNDSMVLLLSYNLLLLCFAAIVFLNL